MQHSRLLLSSTSVVSSSLSLPLLVSHRNLFDFNNYAKEAGLVGKADIPIIDSKVAAIDQILESSLPTVVNKVAEDAQNKNEILQNLVQYLPDLDPLTAWVPVVCSAVVIRTIYCLITRVNLNKNLQQSLPHSEWFYLKRLEYKMWKDRRDIVKMREIKSLVDQYTSENDLRGTISWTRRQFLIRAVAVFGINCCVLHSVSLLYAPQLSLAPFVWVPSLLGHDPLYVLPSMNVILCIAILKLSQSSMVMPLKKFPTSIITDIASSTPSLKGIYVLNIAGKSAGIILVSYFGLNAFLSLSVQFQSLYLLFWIASNLTGVAVTLILMKSDILRNSLGLLPKSQFSNLLEGEKIVAPDRMKAERNSLGKKYDEEFGINLKD